MRLNTPVIQVTVTKEHLIRFAQYCNDCNSSAFNGPYDFQRTDPWRESMLLWHLLHVSEQVLNKLYKHTHDAPNKLIRLKLTHADRVAFSMLCKRVEMPSQLLPLESEILTQLTLKQ